MTIRDYFKRRQKFYQKYFHKIEKLLGRTCSEKEEKFFERRFDKWSKRMLKLDIDFFIKNTFKDKDNINIYENIDWLVFIRTIKDIPYTMPGTNPARNILATETSDKNA